MIDSLNPGFRAPTILLVGKECLVLFKIPSLDAFEIDDIINRIFEKVSQKTIKTSRDFRTLGDIFKKASANEKALYKFLSDPDETVQELVVRTSRSEISLNTEKLIMEIAERKREGVALDPQEETGLKQLAKLLEQIL